MLLWLYVLVCSYRLELVPAMMAHGLSHVKEGAAGARMGKRCCLPRKALSSRSVGSAGPCGQQVMDTWTLDRLENNT